MKSVESLKLIAVRPPKLITNNVQRFIEPSVFETLTTTQIDDLEVDGKLLYFELKSLLNDTKIISLAPALEKVANYRSTVNYYKDVSELIATHKDLLAIYDIMMKIRPGSTMAEVVGKVNTFISDITAYWTDSLQTRIRMWDNLFARHISRIGNEALESLTQFQKVFTFINVLNENQSISGFDIYQEVQNILKSRIKVHYKLDDPIPTNEATSSLPVEPDNSEQISWIESVKELLSKLDYLYDIDIVKYRKLGKNVNTSGVPTNPDVNFEGLLLDFKAFTRDELNLMKDEGINENIGHTYASVSKILTQKLERTQNKIVRDVKGYDRLVNIGNVLIYVDRLCLHLAERDKCSPYAGITLPQGKGNVKPYIADLKVVKTSLYKYELGEIAHIENIISGEKREKVFDELRRTEEVYSTDEETTSEKVRDTQSTERFEFQKEISNVQSQQSQFDSGLNITASYGGVVSISAGMNYSTASSQEQSDSITQNQAKEITEKAVEKVSTRTRTQRSLTQIFQTQEKNTHEINNIGGADHIAAIYRWVNKVYYNKVENYGLRLMFELNVPEPAAFYIYSKLIGNNEKMVLKKPLDPKIGQMPILPPLVNFNQLDVNNYSIWAALYDVQDTNPPPPQMTHVNLAIKIQKADTGGTEGSDDFNAQAQISNEIEIPDGYVGVLAKLKGLKTWHSGSDIQLIIAHEWRSHTDYGWPVPLDNLTGKVPVGIMSRNCDGAINLMVECQLSADRLRDWKIKTFDAIMRGYNRKLEEYESALRSVQTSAGIVIKGNNPLKNREIEKEELKKAAISIITGQRFETFDALVGADPNNTDYRYPEFSFAEAKAEGEYINFFEQAFDWKNISYQFYPYFWGRKPNWIEAKSLEDTDTVFEKFLQAGAARVLVPVQLGYEEAILNYIQTGNIWNGTESLVTNDEYILSIINELEERRVNPAPVDTSSPWLSTLPTNLVYLQPTNTDPVLPDYSADLPL